MKQLIIFTLIIFLSFACDTNIDDNQNDQCATNSTMSNGKCVCDSGYHPENEECVASNKFIECNDNTPDNATVIVQDVEVIWRDNKWTDAKDCEWICNDSLHTEDNATCISNSKEVDCIVVTPDNGTTSNNQVTITWDETWSVADNCPWVCNDGYEKIGDSCVLSTGVCDDGLFCTENDRYNDQGVCVGSVKTCDDNDEGTTDSCDEVNDTCVNTVSTGVCDDGLFCTENDRYNDQGVCVGSVKTCDDNDEGTTDSCDEVNDTCVNTVLTGVCSDGSLCTTDDRYNDQGICVGTPISCDDGNTCTVDVCNENTGDCMHSINLDASCDDGDTCTSGDVCNEQGSCEGIALDCNNGTCNGDGTCECQAGFTGDHCEDVVSCDNGYEGNGVDCLPVIIINETYAGAGGSGWLELYNKGGNSVDLSGWIVTTGDDSESFTISANTTLNAGEYFILRDLNIEQSIDIIKLYDNNFNDTLDSVEYSDLTSPDYSRIPNITGDFADVTIATPNMVNTDLEALTIDWCNTQFPKGYRIAISLPKTIYGRVYIQGVTGRQGDTAVSTPQVAAKVCWDNAGVETCELNTQFNSRHNNDNNDEYYGDLAIDTLGTFDYYYQFSGDMGYSWIRCTDPGTDYQATIIE